jgi:hypothetical protein
MTGSPSRRRLTTIVAASLWLVLAFLVWNVCFDYGVRMAHRFLGARSAFLRGPGPRVEMADTMSQGIGHRRGGRPRLRPVPLSEWSSHSRVGRDV